MDAKDTQGLTDNGDNFDPANSMFLIVFVSVKSRWKWKHPGTGKLHILVPQTVTGVVADNWVKRKSPWLVVGDFPPINDNVAEQDFCATRATNNELQNLWRASYLVFTAVAGVNVQFARVQSSGPQSVTAAKNNTAQWLRDLASSNAENFGRCHEGNSFSSCKSVGKCYRAPSASIGSDGSV